MIIYRFSGIMDYKLMKRLFIIGLLLMLTIFTKNIFKDIRYKKIRKYGDIFCTVSDNRGYVCLNVQGFYGQLSNIWVLRIDGIRWMLRKVKI